MNVKKNYSLKYPKIVAAGFAIIILLGSVLLTLPISSKQGSVAYIDALFTATSATCITGLVPFDTFSSWSVFGQLVILLSDSAWRIGLYYSAFLVCEFLPKKNEFKI